MIKKNVIFLALLLINFNSTSYNILIFGANQYIVHVSKDTFSVDLYKDANIIIEDESKYGYYDEKYSKRYEKYKVIKKIRLVRDSLFYNNHYIQVHNDIKIRNVWQAVKIYDFVVLLCRTSLSDKESLDKRRPFFANELAVFSVKTKKIEHIYWVDFNPPNDNALFILD